MILVATPITCNAVFPPFQEPSNLLKLGDFYSEDVSSIFLQRGMRCHSRLMHCATRRKVVGSILNCVIGIFHQHNLPGHNMALGSTQSPKEMSTRNIFLGVRAASAWG